MSQWADYLISAVRYNHDRTRIDYAKVHKDTGESVAEGKIYPRHAIINAINEGQTFATIYKRDGKKWEKGSAAEAIIKGINPLKTKEAILENLLEF